MLTMTIPDVEIFGGSLGRSVFLTYSPDGTNVYSSRGGEFEGLGFVLGVASCKIVFLWGTSYSHIH